MDLYFAEIPGFNLYLADKNGFIVSKKTNQKIKKIPRKDGYINVHVFSGIVDGKKKYQLKLEHRLIAAAFLGESKLEVNHKNGDKSDNRIENLEYVTRSQNIKHSINVLGNVHALNGFDNYNSKISKDQHKQIVSWYKNKVLIPDELAKFFNVNKATIMAHIRNEKRFSK